MAILTNLVINAGAGEIAVVATDLEVSLRQTIAAKVTEPGSVALSARKLFEIVRESTSPEVTVRSLDGHGVGVSYGRSNFRLLGIDASEHPGMPLPGGGAEAPGPSGISPGMFLSAKGARSAAVHWLARPLVAPRTLPTISLVTIGAWLPQLLRM